MSKKNTTPISAGQWAKALVHSAPRSGWLVGIIAVLIAFALGAILIVITGASVGNAYTAMFKGSIFNASALNRGLSYALRPMVDSIFFAIPLILAGLGLGFGFRAGLFNIGGAGQIIFGALAAIWVSFSLDLPYGLHLLVALIAAAAAGGFYAGIAGYLKAKTGANEVIVTIMLNSVATLALTYVLSLDSWHQPGQNNPVTPVAQDTAALPALLPAPFKLHLGFIIAVVAVFVYWWILERSTFGFEVRAVGANPHAARTAGMSIAKVTTLTMVTSGIFAGIAGANEALGTMYQAHQGVTSGIAGTVGFDAITVALLGRNKPMGIFFSGLLFGAFKAGGYAMQAQGVPIDMVLILESVIVLFIAAPALVRWMFHLPKPDGKSLREYAASLGKTEAQPAAQKKVGAHAIKLEEGTATDEHASTGKEETA